MPPGLHTDKFPAQKHLFARNECWASAVAPNKCPMATAAAAAQKHCTSSSISGVSGSPKAITNDRNSRNPETLYARKVFRA